MTVQDPLQAVFLTSRKGTDNKPVPPLLVGAKQYFVGEDLILDVGRTRFQGTATPGELVAVGRTVEPVRRMAPPDKNAMATFPVPLVKHDFRQLLTRPSWTPAAMNLAQRAGKRTWWKTPYKGRLFRRGVVAEIHGVKLVELRYECLDKAVGVQEPQIWLLPELKEVRSRTYEAGERVMVAENLPWEACLAMVAVRDGATLGDELYVPLSMIPEAPEPNFALWRVPQQGVLSMIPVPRLYGRVELSNGAVLQFADAAMEETLEQRRTLAEGYMVQAVAMGLQN